MDWVIVSVTSCIYWSQFNAIEFLYILALLDFCPLISRFHSPSMTVLTVARRIWPRVHSSKPNQKETTDWQCWQVIYLFQNGSCYGRHINMNYTIITCFCHPHLPQLAPNRGHGVRRRLSPSSSHVHRPSENVSFKICEFLVYPSNRYWTWKRGPSKIIVSFTKVPLSTSMILGGRASCMHWNNYIQIVQYSNMLCSHDIIIQHIIIISPFAKVRRFRKWDGSKIVLFVSKCFEIIQRHRPSDTWKLEHCTYDVLRCKQKQCFLFASAQQFHSILHGRLLDLPLLNNLLGVITSQSYHPRQQPSYFPLHWLFNRDL